MTEPIQLVDVWRRSLEATVKFYSEIGGLAVEWVESLLSTASDSIGAMNPVETTRASAKAEVTPPSTASSTRATMSTMVLEAEAGQKALGVFLVENGFSRTVSASATAGTFIDDKGNQIKPLLEFHPPSAMLEPGEQVLVRVAAGITEVMKPGVRYRGEIAVPDVPGTRIPVVILRIAVAKARPPKKIGSSSTVVGRSRKSSRRSSVRKAKRHHA